LSNPIEALISRITADGPSANRPPHIEWEFDVRSLIGALLLGLVACDAATPADTQKGQTPQAAAPSPAAAGKIDRAQAGTPAPATPFVDKAGKTFRIADFKGRPVLVNLWATWCAPCLAEMPALDRLATREAGRLVVLPVSQDLEGWRAVDKFFAPGKFKTLTPYLDQPNELALAVGAKGLPVSILYDAQGRELWRVNGPLEWDKPEAAKLVPLAASASARTDPWADAKARGADFRAVGQEPGWYMELDAGKDLKLVLDYGERQLVVPGPKMWSAGGANSYALNTESHDIAVAVTPKACNDAMSGAAYPATVTVVVDGKPYTGCGRDL
jgi:thiol-disulfide isomerase/thioredoxin/uncharacterized membrane protein